MSFRKTIIIIINALIINISYALEQQSSKVSVDLSIKPIACIVQKTGEPCHMTVTVNWHASEPIDACLLQDQQSLLCWQHKEYVKQRIRIDLYKDMTFFLISDDSTVYAQQNISVNTITPKSYRRRLRAEWSLF